MDGVPGDDLRGGPNSAARVEARGARESPPRMTDVLAADDTRRRNTKKVTPQGRDMDDTPTAMRTDSVAASNEPLLMPAALIAE